MTSNTSKMTRTIVGMGLLTAIVVVLQMIAATIKFGMFSVTFALIPIVIGAALYGIGAGAWLGLVFGVVVLLSGDAAAFLTINPAGTIITVLLKGALAGTMAGVLYKLISKKESNGRAAIVISGALLFFGGLFLVIHGILQAKGLRELFVFATRRKPDGFTVSAAAVIVIGALLLAAGVLLAVYVFVKKPRISISSAVFASAAICPIVNTGIFLIGCRLFFFETIKEWAAAFGFENATVYMFLGLAGINFIVEFGINLILSPVIVSLIRIGEKSIAKKN